LQDPVCHLCQIAMCEPVKSRACRDRPARQGTPRPLARPRHLGPVRRIYPDADAGSPVRTLHRSHESGSLALDAFALD